MTEGLESYDDIAANYGFKVIDQEGGFENNQVNSTLFFDLLEGLEESRAKIEQGKLFLDQKGDVIGLTVEQSGNSEHVQSGLYNSFFAPISLEDAFQKVHNFVFEARVN